MRRTEIKLEPRTCWEGVECLSSFVLVNSFVLRQQAEIQDVGLVIYCSTSGEEAIE